MDAPVALQGTHVLRPGTSDWEVWCFVPPSFQGAYGTASVVINSEQGECESFAVRAG